MCEINPAAFQKRVAEYINAAKLATNDPSNPAVIKANQLFRGNDNENKFSDDSVKETFKNLLKAEQEARDAVCYAFGNIERKAVMEEFVKKVCDELDFSPYVYEAVKPSSTVTPNTAAPINAATLSQAGGLNLTSVASLASQGKSALSQLTSASGAAAKLAGSLETAGAAASILPTLATGALAVGGLTALAVGGRYLWKNRQRAKNGLTNLIRKKPVVPVKKADSQSWGSGLLILLGAVAFVVVIAAGTEVYQRRAAARRAAARAIP